MARKEPNPDSMTKPDENPGSSHASSIPVDRRSALRSLADFTWNVAARRILVILCSIALLVLFVYLWATLADAFGAERYRGGFFDFGSPGIWTVSGILAIFITSLVVGLLVTLLKILRSWIR